MGTNGGIGRGEHCLMEWVGRLGLLGDGLPSFAVSSFRWWTCDRDPVAVTPYRNHGLI
jgi:hypothetical protein